MEGDAQSGEGEHGEVIGSVAHGNGLLQVNFLHLCDETEKLGLALSVDDVSEVTSSQFAVIPNLKFVGIDVVDAKFLLQVFSKEGKTT